MHHPTVSPSPRAGFSLAELAIVLIIIGLLVGGVLVGKSMLRNAELQTVMSDLVKYRNAALDFRKQYGGLPGDIGDATDYWGACGTENGACNGNWNGAIDATEAFQFWRQLQLSGRLTGKYTGAAGPGGANHSIAEVNVPGGKITRSAWGAGTLNNYAGDAITYAVDFGNYFRIGAMTNNTMANAPLLKPEDAMKIDAKMDDGQPGRGVVVASHWAACGNGGSQTNLNAQYNLASKVAQCTLFFVKQY